MSYEALKCLSKSEVIMKLLEKFYSKLMKNRVTLKRWKKAIVVMLEKGKGPIIYNLRIIQLICSDLQSLMRTVVIPVASELVDEIKLNLSQYTRKQATTISALVEKRLIIESAVLTRDDCVWLVSVITACYNRHIKEIGEVLLISHGVNEDSVATLFKALGEMETQVQTDFGVNKKSYKSTENMVHYGKGKGNVVSVFVCQFGTSFIFYLLEEEFQRWDITDEEGRIVRCKLAIGFVNDTNFFVRRSDSTIEIVGQLYNKYIRLYQAIGGLISLDKSIFYHWRWSFVDGKLKLKDINERQENILLKQLSAN